MIKSWNKHRAMSTQQCFVFLMIWLLYISDIRAQESENHVVTTPLGKIRGSLLVSRKGKPIYSFRGIRYAKAPVNELRFKAPVPVEPWQGIYDATKDGPLCPQPIFEFDKISEDCLMLNVYTTKLPNGKVNPQRPVIVYFHPGGFFSSTSVSHWAGPQYMMDQEVVFVTFNYRIASFGFLSTGDKVAPGNSGLKDQVVVLRWIQKNIASFGGDPNSVTIMGYSAGAWSLILHMVSPMSKGLFHRGIAMSGTPLGIWPIPEHGQLNVAKWQARILGCPDNGTSADIVKCLRTVPFQRYADTLLEFTQFGNDLSMVWSPVVEPECGEPRFLTDHPIRLIVEGKFQKIPIIIGRTTEEFSFVALGVLANETLTKELSDNFETLAPIALSYERNTNFSKYVSRNIKKFYFHDKPIDRSQEVAFRELYEDAVVGFMAHRGAKLLAQYNTKPVYYYKFSYQGRYSFYNQPGRNSTKPYGVVHHDDLIYLLYISKQFPLFNYTDPETVMVEQLTTLYTNFAKTGNPTPRQSKHLDDVVWQPYLLKDRKYLDIGEHLIMKEKLDENRLGEWDKWYPISRYLRFNQRI